MSSVTKEIKLRDFQWKFLHRLIPCNKYLYYWKKRETMECSICMQIDSIEHRYLNCELASKCWKFISGIISKLCNSDVEVSEQHIVFTEPLKNISSKVDRSIIQLLVLLGKWSIHKYWTSGSTIPIENLVKNEMMLRFKIEKSLRSNNDDVTVLQSFEKIIRLM